MGHVPTFPEQNVVAKVDEVERQSPSAVAGEDVAEPARPQEPPPLAEGRPVAKLAEPVERSSAPEPTAEEEGTGIGARPGTGAERTKPSGSRKTSRRRRKHGRSR